MEVGNDFQNVNETLLANLSKSKMELEKLKEEETKRILVRTRIQWYEMFEPVGDTEEIVMGDIQRDTESIEMGLAGTLSNGLGDTSFYEILEVSTDVSRMQVREAYIRLKNTYSRGNQALYSLISEAEVDQSLELLEEAYRVLYDDHLRKAYDQALLEMKSKKRGALDPFGMPVDEGSLDGDSPSIQDAEKDLWGEKVHTSFKNGESAKKVRFAQSALSDENQSKITKIVEKAGTFDGAFLKVLRESQGVSLNEMQDRTKVSLQYIIAMENNDFQTLPSVVYVKGFLKICLQFLGVQKDVNRVIDQYLECLKSWQQSKGIEHT